MEEENQVVNTTAAGTASKSMVLGIIAVALPLVYYLILSALDAADVSIKGAIFLLILLYIIWLAAYTLGTIGLILGIISLVRNAKYNMVKGIVGIVLGIASFILPFAVLSGAVD